MVADTLGFSTMGVHEVGVIDSGKYQTLHEGTKAGRRIMHRDRRTAKKHIGIDCLLEYQLQIVPEGANAFLASLNLTGEARHAALVVQAAVVEVDEFHFGTSLAGTLHSPLQQLRRIAILLSAESTSSRTSTRS